MKVESILGEIQSRSKNRLKSLAVLVDPDKIANQSDLTSLIKLSVENMVDFLFVGGSLITNNQLGDVIHTIRETSRIPIVLFPGNSIQVHHDADAILFLSLISGRNPEFLIGQHVVSAPVLKSSDLEIIPTGYMLVGARDSSVAYMSNTDPIPRSKVAIARSTALAGEMLGLKVIYMDAGSGAAEPVTKEMIQDVRVNVDIPLIVGGGINNLGKVSDAYNAGADVVVIGNQIESKPEFLIEVSDYVRNWNESVRVS